MKLPSQIKIAGHIYKIEVRDGQWSKDSGYRGVTDSNILLININGDMPKSRQTETVIHEIFHGIYHEYGVKENDTEERIVTQFATGIYQVFVDNPELKKML